MANIDLTSCPLAHGDNDEGRCCWCGGELTGRQRRWCSQDCANAYGRNHWWGWARRAALDRDDWTCQECGHAYDDANTRHRNGRRHCRACERAR